MFGGFISSLSQVLLKKAALNTYNTKIRAYLNLYVISAYTIFFVATIITIIAYKGIPLSMGPMLGATSYLYVTVLGNIFFNERINRRKIIGLFFIVLGIVIFY
ncbi:hypothetical protein SAMN02745213_01253 [Succinivibrio dextrinosolvens DSM 3072]|uniref:EamA domain-containing protein n=2 Tax=Succinivibrio dextrinosolvens TaxID=83771 RepID=A0A1T4VCT9_9GAMM|nr:hypothetical protein SAMN02745213_01253 [Succinivibrio dextrinosolvens DSM 3072]